MSKSDAFIESKSLRESVINRTDVLDKVKKLVMLPGDVNTSIELAAEYFEVSRKAVDSLILDHRDELESDGLRVITGNELFPLKEMGVIGKNTASFTVIPRRAILRIGMLLRDSLVARALRNHLLDAESTFTGWSPEMRAIFMLDQRTQGFVARIEKLEHNTTIDYGQQNDLQLLAKKRILSILGGKSSPAYMDKTVRGEAFSAMWNDYKGYFYLDSYKNTLVKDFDKAKEYLTNWRPQGKLLRDIEAANKQLQLI